MLKCNDYADISFLKSIYLYKNNQFSEAKRCYDLGVNMFDGKGFKDVGSNRSRYDTHKLALWKIADKMTPCETKDSSHAVDEILIAMQDGTSNGVHTHYRADLFQDGETNIETTSVSIIASDSDS